MGRCIHFDCKYRTHQYTDDDPACNYVFITGRTRLGDILKRYGISPNSPETRTLFDPANCPFYEPGKIKRYPSIVLPNSKPEKNPNYRAPLPIDERHKRMELYRMGLSDRQAANVLGISRETYRRWRQKEGLAANVPHEGYRGGKELKKDRPQE